MAEEYFGLTCQSLCDALSTLKGAYEATNTDFNLYWSVGEWGKGVHSISESVHVVLSDTISMLKHQQAEIERLKAVINHEPDCANAEHDSGGCLGYSGSHDDEPIEKCKNCEKYTGNN